jgi:pimeloyl-ACP methyl ester carboxylesterase
MRTRRALYAFAGILTLAWASPAASEPDVSANAASEDPAAPKASDPWAHHYFTTEDGIKLHYVEQGSGTPVILIHGAGGSAVGNWFNNGIAAELVATNRVIGIDMRGHGLSEAGDRTKMSADVLEFMQKQGIEQAHIGGYSMGGGITLRLMSTNPEKFITAHFGGSGIPETDEWREKVPADKTGEAPMEAKARAEYARIQAARGATAGQEVGNNAADLRARIAAARAAGGDGAAQLRSFQRPTIDLSTIQFPVLAVNGDYDRPYAKTHRMWRELESFTNVVLKDHGHLSAVMAGITPPEYAESLRKFITENNPKE